MSAVIKMFTSIFCSQTSHARAPKCTFCAGRSSQLYFGSICSPNHCAVYAAVVFKNRETVSAACHSGEIPHKFRILSCARITRLSSFSISPVEFTMIEISPFVLQSSGMLLTYSANLSLANSQGSAPINVSMSSLATLMASKHTGRLDLLDINFSFQYIFLFLKAE
ncbi:uncharacterized protein EDB91DRAFT_203769 [Suillus paluster]|uniref:uncharacterized protein n=1 Tax=Suillus paluster TaxID=48578 RepID=UPI001B871275|nr:uncharacterized protein EDB91DRAFT_203769 [Suillus paluster]KAG1722595.1 hypothetical protein EDB91DRAFT_203769 [Suillus paluster]